MKDPIIIGVFIFLVICLCCAGVLTLGGLGYFMNRTIVSVQNGMTLIPGNPHDQITRSTPTPVIIRPDEHKLPGRTAIPSPTQSTQKQPLATSSFLPRHAATPIRPLNTGGVSFETLLTLQQVEIPSNDLSAMINRYSDLQSIPSTVEPPAEWYKVGEQMNFWVSNVDSDELFRIDATLQYVTDNAYFWIENEVSFKADDLRNLAKAFEDKIYPTNRSFFGSEWTPGFDGDPHVYIVYASGLGDNLAGYFSSADLLHPLIRSRSNAHEMFLLNADNLELDESFTYGVLAHEFQHMIRWYQDRNETSWLNEGFSELAVLLNGYYESGFDQVFASDPDIQLNDWPYDMGSTTAHYGAGFMFVAYVLDRFGDEVTKIWAADPEDGMDSLDKILDGLTIIDSVKAKQILADDIFLDWVITNYVQDDEVLDGRYAYYRYRDTPEFSETERFTRCPIIPHTRTVHQYGADYIRISCNGNYTLTWTGSIQTSVLEAEPHSGRYYLWSNKGDESEMAMWREFDFSDITSPISIKYWTWYDLEEGYDYVYVSASVDGEHWQILTTPSGTGLNPTGSNFSWGYNGRSGGGETPQWIEETVDLSQFAGEVVQLRFDYVTDAAVNGEGFLIDDISIPQAGYYTDFELDTSGWETIGWVRIDNILPQTFQLALIKYGDEISVEYINVNSDLSVEIPLDFGDEIDEVVLVVTATTRYTRQPAAYEFEVK